MEIWLCTLEKPVASQASVVGAAEGSMGPISSALADCPEQPGTQDH